MKNKKTIVIILAIVIFIITAGFITLTVHTKVNKNSICENVYIDSLNVGNMTREQAKAALESYVKELEETEVVVAVGEKQVATSLKEIGVTIDEAGYLDKAMNVGKHGNVFTRFIELRKIKSNKLVYNLSIEVKEEEINKLIDRCKKYEVKAKNADIKRADGEFLVFEAVDGLILDLDQTKNTVEETIENWNKQGTIYIKASYRVEKAKITKENALLCNSILGTYTTSFATSRSGRKKNIRNGASKINGIVVYPGEEFSASSAMGPFDEGNGYHLAGSYLKGKTIESYGGGVCQVSTTLYNALLWSEVDISQRCSHSMTVSYVKPGMDAAISGTSKDLKFINNTDAPIYIEAYSTNTTLTFTIWGHETRAANREIEFESEVEAMIEPGPDVITQDPSLPMSYSKVESHAHRGCKAHLYKVVYIDGIQKSKEKVNFSSYVPSPNYITVGTNAVDEKPGDVPGESKDDRKRQDPMETDVPSSVEPPMEEMPIEELPVED